MRMTQRLINIIVAPLSATLAKQLRNIGSTAVYFYLSHLICLVVHTRY